VPFIQGNPGDQVLENIYLLLTAHSILHCSCQTQQSFSRTTTNTTVLRPFFRDHPGEPVPEVNFWTLWCKGRLTEADTLTIRLGVTPSGLNSAHLHHPPYFFFYNLPGFLWSTSWFYTLHFAYGTTLNHQLYQCSCSSHTSTKVISEQVVGGQVAPCSTS